MLEHMSDLLRQHVCVFKHNMVHKSVSKSVFTDMHLKIQLHAHLKQYHMSQSGEKKHDCDVILFLYNY